MAGKIKDLLVRIAGLLYSARARASHFYYIFIVMISFSLGTALNSVNQEHFILGLSDALQKHLRGILEVSFFTVHLACLFINELSNLL